MTGADPIAGYLPPTDINIDIALTNLPDYCQNFTASTIQSNGLSPTPRENVKLEIGRCEKIIIAVLSVV